MSSLGIFDKETKTYKKVAGLAEAAAVDGSMSDTSSNPVQNKVVKKYVDDKASENVDFSTSTSKTLNDTVEAPLVLSKATRNLLIPDLQTVTANGVTCTNNGDGTYTLNGTATDDLFFDINRNIPINKGTKYKVVCFKDEDYVPSKIQSGVRRVDIENEYLFNNGSFVSDAENCWLWIKIAKDVTVSNLVAKPMITTNLSATYKDFVPYSGYDIKTCGKNLLNLKKVTSSPGGVTASVSNGIITLNGTVDTSSSWQDLEFNTDEQYVSLKSGVKYTISAKDKVQKVFIFLRESNGLAVIYSHDCSTSGTTFVASKDVVCRITVTFKESSTFNNTKIAPQLEVGEKGTEYEPYQDGGTVHIDHTTEFPLIGLKSFDGDTNIISPGNVEVTYAKSDSGAAILDTSEKSVRDVAALKSEKADKSALDGKSDINHTHNYAGSSSAGGSANSAVKLDTATAGSETQPVYFSDGKPVACSYTLGKSVPSDAVFTDTKVTNTLDTHTKAYVTGTTSASTNTGTQIFDTGVYLGTGTGQLTLEGSNNINYGTDASILNVKIPPSRNNTLYGANIVPYRNDMTDYVTGLNIDCGNSMGPGMMGINVTCRVNTYQPTVEIDRSGGTNSYALNVPNGKSYIATIYSDSSTITISDRKKKTDIKSISDKYEELFFKLQPRLFKFKDGTSGRIHIGAVAQEVEEALKDVGLSDTEFAGFVRQEKEYVVNEETGEMTQEEGYDYYLRYEEFVMLLCHMLQKLYAEKEEQDNKISDLESRIVALESKLG